MEETVGDFGIIDVDRTHHAVDVQKRSEQPMARFAPVVVKSEKLVLAKQSIGAVKEVMVLSYDCVASGFFPQNRQSILSGRTRSQASHQRMRQWTHSKMVVPSWPGCSPQNAQQLESVLGYTELARTTLRSISVFETREKGRQE